MAAMTPETRAKRTIIAHLNNIGPTLFDRWKLRQTPASAGIGANGRPDMMAVADGRIIEVEAKAKSNTPTKLQTLWLTATANAGGCGWCVWGDHAPDLAWVSSQLLAMAEGRPYEHLKLEKAP